MLLKNILKFRLCDNSDKLFYQDLCRVGRFKTGCLTAQVFFCFLSLRSGVAKIILVLTRQFSWYNICISPTCIFLVIFFVTSGLPLYAQDSGKQILEQNFDEQTINGENIKEEEQIDIEAKPEIKTGNESEMPALPTLLKGHISKVPGGTKLKIILETPIDEVTSMADDEISARTSENIEVDGKVVIPAGSTVVGKISEINLAKRLHKAGTIRIEFKNLTMPDGRQVPILASVLTHSGLIKGKYTRKTALIAGATLLGPAAAGFGAGLAAEGSLVGAGIGALVGTLAGVGLFTFQRGNMVDLKSGDELSIELTEEALVPSGDGGEISEEEKGFCDLRK